ncbi:MAG: sensor histidine kinase [Chitinophagaceae bacterium]
MKLFSKYSRINLLFTVLIFLVACSAFFFLLRHVLVNQVDWTLKTQKEELIQEVEKYHHLPDPILLRNLQEEFIPLTRKAPVQKFQFVRLLAPGSKHFGLFRRLNFMILVNGQWFLVRISKSLKGTEDLTQAIITITVTTILLILLASFLINKILLTRLWRPFYHTLSVITGFQLGKKEELNFPRSTIEEFNLLNATLEQTTQKARQDYLLLKEFTENASHEMQTPLAIIRSKLDLLIQDEHLSEPQTRTVQSAYTSIQKLARLNQSLLLLTKIENRQFQESSLIDLTRKVQEIQDQFQELWKNKGLEVSSHLEPSTLVMNPELADFLLNNLFSNATKHNIPRGKIELNLVARQFSISNTGPGQPLDPTRLFSRFYKAVPGSESTGLGLSIIYQIAEISGISIRYEFLESRHRFLLNW